MLPKKSRQVKSFDETKYMYFLIEDDELFKKYNKIWVKVSNSIKKGFNSKNSFVRIINTLIYFTSFQIFLERLIFLLAHRMQRGHSPHSSQRCSKSHLKKHSPT